MEYVFCKRRNIPSFQRKPKNKKMIIMKNMVKALLLQVTLFCAACGGNKLGSSSADVAITIDSICLDTVTVDYVENCSYTGFSGVKDGTLYYFDRVMAYLYMIADDGSVESRELGLGNSAKELPLKNAMQVCYDSEGKTFDILGGTYNMYTYGNGEKIRRVEMKPEGDDGSYESSVAYTLWDEVVMASDKDYIYYNVLGNNEKVDIFHRDDYIDKAAVMMKVSKSTGEMTPIGRYSDYYIKNKSKFKHLPYCYFDTDGNGGFYFTYQVDSLVYHYDKDFNLLESFGRQGRDMCVELSDPGTTEESFVEAFMTDKDRVGHYYWIKKCGDYVFRSYFKSNESPTDGLQIYKNGTIIGDVDVPRAFRVAGQGKDGFFTNITFEENAELMSFYKFKLE